MDPGMCNAAWSFPIIPTDDFVAMQFDAGQGHNEYLAALDEAVLEVLRGKKTPEESLGGAAKLWEEITSRRGLASQQTALERSLGLRRTN